VIGKRVTKKERIAAAEHARFEIDVARAHWRATAPELSLQALPAEVRAVAEDELTKLKALPQAGLRSETHIRWVLAPAWDRLLPGRTHGWVSRDDETCSVINMAILASDLRRSGYWQGCYQWRDDYFRLRHTLRHEAAHLWQFQHGGNAYPLSPKYAAALKQAFMLGEDFDEVEADYIACQWYRDMAGVAACDSKGEAAS